MGSSFLGNVSRERLKHNITILWALNEIQEIEQENQLRPDIEPHARHLSAEREREIADNLAFLCATSDDPLKVRAVCLEEEPNTLGVIVRLASNTGGLLTVKHGLERIARIMQRAARRGLSYYLYTKGTFC